MDKRPLTQSGVLIVVFCLTGTLLSSNAIGLNNAWQGWVLCASMLFVMCQLFVGGELGQTTDGLGEILLLTGASVAMPFLLGFLTVMAVREGGPQIDYRAVATVFVLSLGWPIYTIFVMAKELRFHAVIDDTSADRDIKYIGALLASLESRPSFNRNQRQNLQSLSRRLAAASRLELVARARVLASVAGSLQALDGMPDEVGSDRVLLAYGRRKNIGLVDQLIAASSFISVVVTVGGWTRIPYAVAISRFRVLSLVVDLRLLVLAALVACLGTVAIVHVAKAPRPIPPRLTPLEIGMPRGTPGSNVLARIVFGLRVGGTNAVNALLTLVTVFVNIPIYIGWTLVAWVTRVFKQMAHIALESIMKAGTWKLTVYLLATFLGFLFFGALLGVLEESIVSVVVTDGGMFSIGLTSLTQYLSPLTLFVAGTIVLVTVSFLLNLLFDRERQWPELQLNDLLLGLVPVAVALPIAGFILWAVANVFPAASLRGFQTFGLMTTIGTLSVLGYALVIAYKLNTDRRRP